MLLRCILGDYSETGRTEDPKQRSLSSLSTKPEAKRTEYAWLVRSDLRDEDQYKPRDPATLRLLSYQ